jgi:hypothetical protein
MLKFHFFIDASQTSPYMNLVSSVHGINIKVELHIDSQQSCPSPPLASGLTCKLDAWVEGQLSC